jgi:Major Facilitator Superfamily
MLPALGNSADPGAAMAAPTDTAHPQGGPAPKEPVPNRQPSNRSLSHAAIIVVAGVLATTLAQPQVLARLPLQNLLKNELHLDRSSNAAFFFWAGLAWYLKPFAGIVTDAFPLFGSRRKSYIALSATLAALAWFALTVTPHTYRDLLLVVIVINIFMVVTSTVVGGFMVEIAQAVSGSGRLTAIRQFVQQACLIVNGPAAGYLASVAFGWTAWACGGIMFLLVPVTILYLREQPQRLDSRRLLGNANTQLVNIASARAMWAAAGLMALFYIAPGFATALFYKQQNDLHMDTHMQGFLQLIGGVFGVLAAVGYGILCRRMKLHTLLAGCIILGTAANLGYLFYSSVGRAQAIEGFNGFGYTLAELALMDLAVRATPAGSEGLGFSLMVSVRNLALFGTDWFGSKLLDQYHFSFDSLVIANSVTTAAAVPLVFLLPRIITGRKDAEPVEDGPIAKTAME